jgi:hypothetical protein
MVIRTGQGTASGIEHHRAAKFSAILPRHIVVGIPPKEITQNGQLFWFH